MLRNARNLGLLLLVCLSVARGQQKINPATQINWPANCQVYNVALASCPAVGVVNFTGNYSAFTTYNVNDAAYVSATGITYVSLQNGNLNNNPPGSPSFWAPLFAGGVSAGVSSFNTRTGAVTLTASDVNAVGAITNNTSGNAATASTLSGTPTQCPTGQFAKGIAANGNAQGCAPGGGGTIATTLKGLAGDNSGNAVVMTPQVMANTLLDSSGSSFYLTTTYPTITGSVVNNVVIGPGTGQNLAPGASSLGGQADTFVGYRACASATSARELTCIGYLAGENITGNGTGADDMIGVLIGSLSGHSLTNLGGSFICIGQKCAENSSALYGTIALSQHALDGVTEDGDGTNNTETSGGSVFVGSGPGGTTNKFTSHDVGIGGNVMQNVADNSVLLSDTGVGFKSLMNLDGSGGSLHGSRNTALGAESGQGIGRGSNNLVLGFQSGSGTPGQITGTNNVLIDTGAVNLTSGSYNWIWAPSAGYALSDGSSNILMGIRSGANLQHGNNNIEIGFYAGDSSGDTNNDVLIGRGAGDGSRVDGLVAVGFSAGLFSTTGTGDTYVGNLSSSDNVSLGNRTGSNVTCVGDSTCWSITNQNNLTAIGASADFGGSVSGAAEIGAGQNLVSDTLAFRGYSFLTNTGNGTFANALLTSAAPTAAAGQIGLGSTTATSASAGTNGAVPLQVAGYLIWNVAGTTAKVPYFAN